ncbi:MAG: deoxyribose-phosphate aldolase [Calditrichaeota bacterium]|nr:MAG: deoxyribose-phosphate aldolase [Calditrichota bacterium]
MPPTRSSTIRTIAIGADHGGFELKEQLKAHLQRQGYVVEDVGTYKPVSVDYPLFAYKVARKVVSGECQRGIMVDGAGIGSCMAANKVPGIRAAMCYDVKTAVNSREHNDANLLTLGGRMIDVETAKQIVDVWLTTECTEPRHRRRVGQIMQIERELCGGENPRKSRSQTGVRESMSDLTTSELEQIAEQITEILRARGMAFGGLACACSCCGGDCGGHCAEKASDTVRQFIHMGASRITYRAGGQGVPGDLAKYIDHTLLKPDASSKDIEKLCEDARHYGFASVCVNPTYVALAARMLRGSEVKVCSVVGFPLGTHTPQIKALETRQAVRDGAREIDMVINIGALKDRNLDLLYRDIRSVVEACLDGNAICKVIIETALLTDEEKIIACETAKRARAHFVKTSTGFGPGGATTHDVALMASVVRESGMGVKASGGIRSYEDALKMIEAGATRIGASASVQIIQGATQITESN